jgi:hypothetical protein
MKRYLIIAALLIVALGLAFYFFYFKTVPGVEVSPGASGLPSAGQGTFPIETPSDTSDTSSDQVSPVTVTARLVKISVGPVVPGEVVLNFRPLSASSSPETIAQFIERKSGNVFSYLVSTHTLVRTNNKTIPGIESASWLPNGSTAFVRYLSGSTFSTVNTYALSATSSVGYFLPQNLSDIAVSSTSVLTLASGVSGSSASLLHTDGSHTMTTFTTPLSSLRVSFAGKTNYLAFTKPNSQTPGYAFLVSGGHFSRIAGPLNGLVALASPLGKWVLVSYTSSSGLAMEIVDTATGETLSLPVATIADKCVWAADDSVIYCGVPKDPPSATYPDDWYQGVLGFTDRIWKIQIAGDHYTQLVLDFSTLTEDVFDVQSPALDPHTTTLVFVNKNDGSLWSYSL